MSNIRRTMMAAGRGGEELIERPDYFRFDFETSEDNVTLQIGGFVSSYIDDCILDEVSTIPTGANPTTITVPTAGSHTLYYRLGNVVPSNYNLALNSSASYVRLPYNTSEMCLSLNIRCNNWSQRWVNIDILDENFVGAVKANGYGTYSNATLIRVPIGATQTYIDNGTGSIITNKMEEVDFKYNRT